MSAPTLSELYLAYRQAKISLFYERRGVGLLELSKFEAELEANLRALQRKLAEGGGWFDELDVGELWLVPKRVRHGKNEDRVVRIGTPLRSGARAGLDVQVRCTPSPEFAIAEVLFLRRFGPSLDAMLSEGVLGYRLDLGRGALRPHGRWLFEYWPRRYEQYRRAPLEAGLRELREGGSVIVLSADFASYYDTVHGAFLLNEELARPLNSPASGESSPTPYTDAIGSLLRAHDRFRQRAASLTGHAWSAGIPIGPLSSRLVANLALATLDAAVSSLEGVVCYRRYVDDIVVVARAEMQSKIDFDNTVEALIPGTRRVGDTFALDVEALRRPQCEFSLQERKIRVHHLSGLQGQTFLSAVGDDFQRLVSERRAFVDPSVMADETAKHVIRAGGGEGSPLRVLRDADRARLEAFALGTSLQSLERISALVDAKEAREQVRETLDRVIKVLDSEDTWTESLDLLARLLRLAISTGDADSTREILVRTDAIWGSVDRLKERVGPLFHRDRRVEAHRAWVWLRNYMHERRQEAVIDSVPPSTPSQRLQAVLGDGLLVRTQRIGAQALLRRARVLAASDLRMRDREDDGFTGNSRDTTGKEWMREALTAPDLSARLDQIERFVERIRSPADPWSIAPARLFLCTRPPSYFDIARRYLGDMEGSYSIAPDLFEALLAAVNAVRGTSYRDPVGAVVAERTVAIPADHTLNVDGDSFEVVDPKLILGNLVCDKRYWTAAADGTPIHSWRRLRGLAHVLYKADVASRQSRSPTRVPESLLVLPELSVPRSWFRAVSHYVVRLNQHGLVVGLEYEHHPDRIVENQVHAVLPGPYQSTATWSWTKGFPAHQEGLELAEPKRNRRFRPVPPRGRRPKRIVARTVFGDFSVLICSELLETPRVADLLGDVELILAPSWNTDTSSYDHVIRTIGMHLCAIVAVANNGHYSDCRAWGPRTVRWQRDLCRLVERDVDSVVTFELPLTSLRAFRRSARTDEKADWRPLPPDWP